MKFEKKLVEAEKGSIRTECGDVMKKEGTKSGQQQKKRIFFGKGGWSKQEAERRLGEGEEIWWEMTQRGKDIAMQENKVQIEESRYAIEAKKIIITEEAPEYLGNKRKNKKGEMEIIGEITA